MKPDVAFLTSSGTEIGLGHLRRCLTLAEELAARGAAARFWLSGDPAGVGLVAESGFTAELLQGEAPELPRAELLIVDDYSLSGAELRELRRRAARLAVIDDLADGVLDVDLVQNGNASAATLTYRTGHDCIRLLGPRYALLGRAFRDLPQRRARQDVARVLVTFGGADPQGLTPAAVSAVQRALSSAAIDVVIGPLFRSTSVVEPDDRVSVHRAPPTLASFMLDADCAVTAGGQTTYELAAAGVPSVALCVAPNQKDNLVALAEVPTLLAVSGEPELPEAIRSLAADRSLRQEMIDAGQRLVDGRGTERVAEALLSLLAEVHACA
jgi:UDP-2,4-diacetamido-2,4,6-trideoxy-beta-L-altropyranose hydrolase